MENQIINLSRTIDSREVAEMLGKDHANLLKDIQGSGKNLGIIPVLEKGNFHVSEYFVESSYKIEGNNKTYKCYGCTKLGCEMLGNKLQGEKGILFTAAYVKKFNEMEVSLKAEIPTNSYMIEDPIKRAERWIEEQKEKQALEAKTQEQAEEIKVLEPKAKFADAVSDADNCILIREMAKILKQSGIDIGEKRLYTLLRNKGLLIKKANASDYNSPTQDAMDKGLFRVKASVINTNPSTSFTTNTTKITPKGQQYILNKFLNKEWTI